MIQHSLAALLLAASATALPAAPAQGGPPPGYYATVDTSSQAALRATIHAVIDDHARLPYSSGATDTWDALEAAQTDPASPSAVLDIYRNRSFQKQGGGNSLYNREHSWPKSYGFPDDGGANMPYTDCHMLFLCDDGYNTSRSNKPFGDCSASCGELTTDANGGVGGGSGAYPGQSNWTSGSFSSGTFEVNPFRRGDIARALFYAAIRYEGGNHGTTGVSEPDLELTDNLGLIGASNTGQNEAFGYMGRLTVLLAWHLEDPVDDFERGRNDVVAAFQGNRNPFVDHPEWVACVFEGGCTPGATYCSPAVPNSTLQPAEILGLGSAFLADNDFQLSASGMPQSQFGFFVTSQTQGIVLGPGGSAGNLCLGGTLGRAVGGSILNTDIFGAFQTTVDLTAIPEGPALVAAQVGETWNFQAWFRDVQFGQQTSNFTNGWTVTWQ